ncbi:hypothetical protein [Streptomyces sp. NPDC088258]|uniref:hypothetical protein n=1 Tax=Streptomyces sp. NPDC088258 TaxID=3365849 RepID=UPI00380E7BCB
METRGWAAAVAVLGGAAVGFVVWGVGAAPGLTGGFEGEGQDFSLLCVELPLMVFGMPALGLAVWALVAGALRWREGVAALAVVGTLALGAWGGTQWLESRTAPAVNQREGPL